MKPVSKNLTLFLALLLTAQMTACGTSETAQDTAETAETTAVTEPSNTAPVEPPQSYHLIIP